MTNTNNGRSGAELRRQRRERNALEIQAVALALFAQRGYSAVTVEDIATEAGISERTFFRYFATKDQVLVAEAERSTEMLCEALESQPAQLGAWDALRNALVEQVLQEEAAGRDIAMWAQVSQQAPALVANLLLHGALEGNQRLVEVLATRIGVPTSDPLPSLMVRVAMSATRSVHLLWLHGDSRESLAELTARVLDLVGDGLSHAASGSLS